MKMKKSVPFRVLMPLGVVLITFPLLFKEYIPMSNFSRVAIEGTGLGLEIVALIIQRRLQRGGAKTAERYTQ
jgi:hypothetical protein